MSNKLRQYCELVIRQGIAVQKGQTLVINAPAECVHIARILVEEAYKVGAKEVMVRLGDEKISRLNLLNADISVFETFPSWEKLRLDTLAEQGAAFLSISSADPEAMKGVDPAKMMASAKASSQALKEYRRKMMADELQWCVFSVPSENWAKKVFPDCGAEEAIEKLWDAIFDASRVSEEGSAEKWAAHTENFKMRAKFMNEAQFEKLIYSNKLGTQVEVRLPKNHIWGGGGAVSTSGVDFSPNIPTEELFTAPQADGVDGVVYATKPLVYMGNLIEDFVVWFEKGKVTKVTAKKNQELLEKLITNFENADRLGEVALVPHDSPISQSGILFYNTLYDENASCHFAFGNAYPTCIKDSEGKSEAELSEMGLNISHAHHDFMVGSADMNIVGIKHDGTRVQIFENGNYAF